jgi:hypothetical protein
MSHVLLAALGRQTLDDFARSSPMKALRSTNALMGNPSTLLKSAPASASEDMDARLRSIRRYITPRELAALFHWHPETVYRKIKAGLPADRVVDEHGRGRQLKIYPPQVADWLRVCRDALRRPDQLTSRLSPPYRGASEAGIVVERRK